MGVGLVVVAALLGAPRRAAAEAPPDERPAPRANAAPYALAHTSPTFLGAEFLATLVVFAAYGIASGDAATSCGWCETNAFDRSVRRGLMIEDSRLAGTLSRVLSLGVTPAIAIAGTIVPALSHGKGSYALEDTVIILNALVLTTGITEGTKRLADRRRPAFVYGRESQTEASDSPEEEFLSFYSGDTARAFSFAASGTTLAYLRGYSSAPYVAINGAAFAVGAGVLRIVADMHWATDVMMGAVAGTAIGAGVPLVLHRRDGTNPRLAIAPSITGDRAMLVAAGSF